MMDIHIVCSRGGMYMCYSRDSPGGEQNAKLISSIDDVSVLFAPHLTTPPTHIQNILFNSTGIYKGNVVRILTFSFTAFNIMSWCVNSCYLSRERTILNVIEMRYIFTFHVMGFCNVGKSFSHYAHSTTVKLNPGICFQFLEDSVCISLLFPQLWVNSGIGFLSVGKTVYPA